MYSEAMFRKPWELFDRPLAEGALYLENPRIQYIHAMCLARPGGEHIYPLRDVESQFNVEHRHGPEVYPLAW